MQNIIEICKEFGLEIPDDKQKEFTSKVAENYKTVVEVEKKLGKLETERDQWKEKCETAETTLKGFEGKDFETIEKERKDWENKYNDLIKKQEEEKDAEELNASISKAIAEAKGKDEKSILAHLDMDSIKASKNRDKDIADAIKSLSESENTAFLFNTDPEGNRAKFTNPMQNSGGKVTMTRDEIMAIKDRGERRQAMLENKELFPSLA